MRRRHDTGRMRVSGEGISSRPSSVQGTMDVQLQSIFRYRSLQSFRQKLPVSYRRVTWLTSGLPLGWGPLQVYAGLCRDSAGQYVSPLGTLHEVGTSRAASWLDQICPCLSALLADDQRAFPETIPVDS
ncbi:hypothetical protein PMIN03_010179 [Paraphaeosphaeria minitans]